jgi:NOL1/NOP2/sun family putative RNA methylase
MTVMVPPITRSDLAVFRRYHTVLDDVSAFEQALRQPLPRFVWTNTLRTSPAALSEILTQAGYRCRPLPWHADAFCIEGNSAGLGRHWSYFAGYFQVQEASAMVPVCLLNPKPGERILDLCAAPGNKTAQMGVAVQNRGTIVANEPAKGRLGALRSTLDRLGLINVTITGHNGTAFPKSAGEFDTVLVDAPCSCEGISRKNPGILKRLPQRTQRYDRKQTALLETAVRRCRPGGRILYSTCTYAPEENEAVVNAVLRAFQGQVEVLPAVLPGLRVSPGLTRWSGAAYCKTLRHTLRIWPHLNDSGGFYVALLRKRGDARRGTPQALPPWPTTGNHILAAQDRRAVEQLLVARFGFDAATFERMHMTRANRRDVSIVAVNHVPPPIRCVSTGLPLMHFATRYPKLTTAGAAAIGRQARRNCITMRERQLQAFMARCPVALTIDQQSACEGSGFVLMRYADAVLGVGFYREREGVVASLFPKNWALPAVSKARGCAT